MAIVRSIACFVLAFIATLILALLTRSQAYEEQSSRLQTLKDKYVIAKWRVLRHDLLLEQLQEEKVMIEKLAKILPAQIDTSFAPVLAAARRHHLGVQTSAVGKEIDREFYASRGIGIAVIGRFHDLGAFAAELGSAPGCLILDSLNLSRAADGKVRMEGVVWAHRYLTDAEIEERRKAAKAGKS